MYQIRINDTLIFDDVRDDKALALASASVVLEVGKAGVLTFTLPPSNIIYDDIKAVTDYCDLYRNGELIWSGRVYAIEKDYNGLIKVTCEGLLAVFNDSVIRPTTLNGTLTWFISQFLDNHNAQDGDDKKVKLANISVTDANDYIFRSYENHETTMTRLEDLVEVYGGYMGVRRQEDGLFFDWISDYGNEAPQTIDFGMNLINLTQEADASEIFTVLIPLGADLEDEDGNKLGKLTIASVNGGLDYIENEDAVAEYGRIVAFHEWDDVTTPEALLAKGRAYLTDLARGRVTINVSAVDMAKAGSSISAWKLGDSIKVNCEAFGVNERLEVKALSLNLLEPAANSLTMASTKVGFIGKTQNNADSIRIKLEYVENDISGTMEKVTELYTSLTTSIEQTSEDITMLAKVINGDATAQEIDSWSNASLKLTALGLRAEIENSEKQSLWISVDAEDGVTIGRKNSAIKSVQDNESYRYINTLTGETLVDIDTTGLTSLATNLKGQLTILNGETKQWAIRKGAYVNGVGVNLNDVWIG